MIKVGIITTSRADGSIYLPLIKELSQDNRYSLLVYALAFQTNDQSFSKFSNTKIFRKVGFNSEDFSPLGVSQKMSETSLNMTELLRNEKPDLFICLGDRYEMLAAVTVIVPLNIPIIHLCGGDKTFGSIDDKFRNAISKLANYHFVTCEEYRKRLIQMGEKPETVFTVGSLGAEAIRKANILSLDEIQDRYGVDLSKDTIIVTYHPETHTYENFKSNLDEFCQALRQIPTQLVITLGNLDAYGDVYRQTFKELSEEKENIFVFDSLGNEGYPSFLHYSKIMIGNSSSGIVECASKNVVTLNVGNRQNGRAFSSNTISVPNDCTKILHGLDKAWELVGQDFINIHDEFDASERILECMNSINCFSAQKEFYDLEIKL